MKKEQLKSKNKSHTVNENHFFCPVSLADPFVLTVRWHDFIVTFTVVLLLCNEMVLRKCFLGNCNRKLKVS